MLLAAGEVKRCILSTKLMSRALAWQLHIFNEVSSLRTQYMRQLLIRCYCRWNADVSLVNPRVLFHLFFEQRPGYQWKLGLGVVEAWVWGDTPALTFLGMTCAEKDLSFFYRIKQRETLKRERCTIPNLTQRLIFYFVFSSLGATLDPYVVEDIHHFGLKPRMNLL